MFLYACTIFLGAFLLFEVQPMIGKIVLPWFGGSAAVWSTCLLFFQATLLGGYLYAHLSTRYLKPRRQAGLHIALMAVSLALLPILPSPTWKPTHPGDPSGRILALLAASVGLPYVLLSTTSPLLQAWYVAAKPGAIPYRLFALSNLGSLLALFSYPLLVEPALATRTQAWGWSGVYVAFVLVCATVAWRLLRSSGGLPVPESSMAQEPAASAPGWGLYLLWTALAACASALLLGFTNHMSHNVAPIPFLWVLPLGIYLLTFILCFDSERVYRRAVFLPALILTLSASAFTVYFDQSNPPIKRAIPLFATTLFVCCMVCHGELVRLKPNPRFLTSFYLMVALGGALGGLFVAFLAPHIFHTFVELPAAMVACAALAALVVWLRPGRLADSMALWPVRIALLALPIGLGFYLWQQKHEDDALYEVSMRNFYAVLRVREMPESEDQTGTLRLIHGTINHGTQLLDPQRRRTPTAYYGPRSGMGRAIRYEQKHGPVRVGVVGLGAGVTASYCRPGDVFRFYEINPLGLAVALTKFSFLRDCPAEHEVFLGDARLTMESQESQQFDVLAIDAFSSDAIPVHLLTREAAALYFHHLKPAGILAVHVSNRYLNLIPVVAQHAHDLHKMAMNVDDEVPEEYDYLSSSDWVLVSADHSFPSDPVFQDAHMETAKLRPGLRPWTDDYSNLFQILK